MKRLIPFLLILSSCASAEVRTEVCKESAVSYQDLGLKRVGSEKAGEFVSDFDISAQINELGKYGTIAVYVSRAEIDSLGEDLTWIGSIRVDLVASTGEKILLSESVIAGKQRKVKLNVNQSVNLHPYLSTGGVKLVYTVKGDVPPSFRVNNNLCFSLNGISSKDVSDIK